MARRAADIVHLLSFRDPGADVVTGGRVTDRLRQLHDRLRGTPDLGLVLLIHGFEVDEEEADKAYAGFFERNREIAGLPPDQRLVDDRVFVAVRWPGDGPLGPLFYPKSIGRARTAAHQLAAVLAHLANGSAPLRIDVVAHSMGCRLTSEMLHALHAQARVAVRRVVFLAAAVPTYMLSARPTRARLRLAFDERLGARQGRALSLFSTEDGVLRFAFPPGQTAAGEGRFPTAVGRERMAAHTTPACMTQHRVVDAGHSDYWGWRQKPGPLVAARAAQRQVHAFLSFKSAAPRAPEIRTGATRDPLDPRTVAGPRLLGRRDLPD